MTHILDLAGPVAADAGTEQFDARWQYYIRRELALWRHPTACPACGEWVGHFGGSAERAPCRHIPLGVPLEEVRPNCYTVQRNWAGDAIRAACKG